MSALTLVLVAVVGSGNPQAAPPARHPLGPAQLVSSALPSTADADLGWITTQGGDLIPFNAVTAQTGTPVNALPPDFPDSDSTSLYYPSMSPDGTSVYYDIYGLDEYDTGQPLVVYQAGVGVTQVGETGSITLPNDPEGTHFGYPAVMFTPSGSTAYIVVPGVDDLYTVDLSNPAVVTSAVALPSEFDGFTGVALSPDGSTLYAVIPGDPGYINAFSTSTGDFESSQSFSIGEADGGGPIGVDPLTQQFYVEVYQGSSSSYYLEAYTFSGTETWSATVPTGRYAVGDFVLDTATGYIALSDYFDGLEYLFPIADEGSDYATFDLAQPGVSAFTPDGLVATIPAQSGSDAPVATEQLVPTLSAGPTAYLTSAEEGATGVSFLPFASPLGGPLAWQEMLAGDGGEPCGPCFAARLGMQFAGDTPNTNLAAAVNTAGDPVETESGGLDEAFTDATVASYGPLLDFTRTYSSQLATAELDGDAPVGPLGYGWSENWDAYVTVDGGDATVTEGSGAANFFEAPTGTPLACPIFGQVDPLGLSTTGSYCAAPRVTATLSYSAGTDPPTTATYTYTLGDGTVETFADWQGAWLLSTVADANGAKDTLEYDTPTPGSSSDCNTSFATSCLEVVGPGSSGDRFLVLAFNGTNDGGQLVKVSDSQGRHWSYGYDTYGNLTSVTDPRGYTTTYGYDSLDTTYPDLVHDLVSIATPNGTSPSRSAVTSFCDTPTSATAPGGATVDCYADDASTGFGQVVDQVDPMKRVTTFSYTDNPASDPMDSTTVTDPDGNTVVDTYVFDELVSESESPNSAGQTSTWYYERDQANLLPTEVINPDGEATAFTYDTAGNVLSETNALGQTSTYSYQSPPQSPRPPEPNFEVQVCAALPEAATTCQADASGSNPPPSIVASTTTTFDVPAAPPAFTTYSQYDSDGDLDWTSVGQYAPGAGSPTNTTTSYWLYNGQSVDFGTYDTPACSASAPEHGLPCETVNPSAADTNSGSSSIARAVTQLGYDSDGDLASSAIPDGNAGPEFATTTWTYNGDGQVSTEVSPLGNSGLLDDPYTTAYSYDADGLVTEVDRGTGGGSSEASTEYGYDHDDNETSVENPLTGTTYTTYDADDEPNLVTDPDVNATLTCYDGDGQVAQVVPPTGAAAGSLTGASCPTSSYTTQLESDATTYAYDALGDVTSVRSPAPNGRTGDESYETTTSTYDAAGRLVKTVTPSADTANDPGGVVTLDNYDPSGRLVASSTGSGSSLAVTSYCYDPDGDETAAVPPDGNSSASVEGDGLTLTGYAACASSSPYGTSSSYQTGDIYDSTGNLLTDTLPDGGGYSGRVTTDTYDASGQLTSSEDPNGVTEAISYTPLGEVASQSYSGGSGSTPSVTDTYDANGELTQMVDGTGTSTYGYDNWGDLTSYENGDGLTVSYEDNKLGEPTQITYPLPTGTSWDTHPYATLAYDDAGLLTSVTDQHNAETQFSYTDDELLKTVTFPSTIGTVTDSYDNADNIDEVNALSSTFTYSYDYEPSGTVANESDTPTAAGVSPTYNYDTLSRVTKLTPGMGSATSYRYDQSGNLTTMPAGAYAGASGTYDDASELTSIGAGTTVDLAYDADGNRVSATQGSTTLAAGTWNGADELTSYSVHGGADMSAAAYDGSGLREFDTVGSTTNHFVWDASSATPRLLEDHADLYIYGPSGTPIEQIGLSGGTRKYLVADALGSVRAVISTTGGDDGATSYDAYGTPTGTGVSSNSFFGFAGGYTDATGLVYLVHRYYDPATGQFLSVDPLVDQTGHAYAYAGGDPVDNSDPIGTWPPKSKKGKLGVAGLCLAVCINGVPVPGVGGTKPLQANPPEHIHQEEQDTPEFDPGGPQEKGQVDRFSLPCLSLGHLCVPCPFLQSASGPSINPQIATTPAQPVQTPYNPFTDGPPNQEYGWKSSALAVGGGVMAGLAVVGTVLWNVVKAVGEGEG